MPSLKEKRELEADMRHRISTLTDSDAMLGPLPSCEVRQCFDDEMRGAVNDADSADEMMLVTMSCGGARHKYEQVPRYSSEKPLRPERPPTVPCSAKRKFDEIDSPTSDDRQSILNISMCKLRLSPRKRVEPSLRRSVLIFNTLKKIERQLRNEGVSSTAAETAANLWPSLQPAADNTMDTLDTPPGAELMPVSSANPSIPTGPLPPPPCSVSLPLEVSASETNATNITSLSSSQTEFTAVTSKPVNSQHMPFKSEFSSLSTTAKSDVNMATAAAPRTKPEIKLPPLKVSSSASDLLLNTGKLTVCSLASLYDFDVCGEFESPMTSATSTSMSSPTSTAATFSNLTSPTYSASITNQDIFGDIDLSLYDFDLLQSIGPSMKLAPLSAEELLHSFPVDQSSPYSPAAPRRKNDLISDDIDHIMQVLVGI